MTELRVVIVDDEPLVRRDLERLLGQVPGVAVVGTAADGVAALEAVEAHRPDVLFLDVRMPELDGLGVVEMLPDGAAPLVVFVTAHDQHAVAAFDADAVDYLLKPFDAVRLERAVERVRERLGNPVPLERVREAAARALPPAGHPERLAVRTSDRVVVVDLAEVHWIEASGNYARLHLEDRSYLTRRTMRDLERTLDPARFARVHRSHIVALAAVREFRSLGDGDHELRLRGGARLVLTRTYRAEFERRFGGVA